MGLIDSEETTIVGSIVSCDGNRVEQLFDELNLVAQLLLHGLLPGYVDQRPDNSIDLITFVARRPYVRFEPAYISTLSDEAHGVAGIAALSAQYIDNELAHLRQVFRIDMFMGTLVKTLRDIVSSNLGPGAIQIDPATL